MAFTRPANNRQLTFNEVALKTQLPEDDVELLVMRALSIGLVKGSIDQVDKGFTSAGSNQECSISVSTFQILLELFVTLTNICSLFLDQNDAQSY